MNRPLASGFAVAINTESRNDVVRGQMRVSQQKFKFFARKALFGYRKRMIMRSKVRP